MARAILLRQLTLGPRSRLQLERKLRDRNVPMEVAAALLDRFEDVGLVDDAEFARMWVRGRGEAKSLGRSALRRELNEKGITGDLAEEALEELTPDAEEESARRLLARRVRPFDRTDPAARDKELRRLVGLLARKGHSPGSAFRLAAQVIDADSGDNVLEQRPY
ncbi:regulatory protein RecX [Sinomonas notoginsengisoli]|uniref:regulatory protein RecX n=1 Tax=Sinomonas notoginsengisoli TaxID=1457311 RepID=UPI001F2F6720|nr:regulatory protein RecX [Sinomonas notoginsengisoli]